MIKSGISKLLTTLVSFYLSVMLHLLKLVPQSSRFASLLDLIPALIDQVSNHGYKSVGKLIVEDAVDTVALKAGYQLVPVKQHDGNGKNVEEKGAASPSFDEGVDVGDGGIPGGESVPRKQTLLVNGKNDFKNVVVIGGSIVGQALAMQIRANPLPHPYRVIIIEKHSHAHYMFAFPRAATIPGIESALFAPYTNTFPSPSIGTVINAFVTKITKTHVELDREIDGSKSVEFDYLVMATGANHPEPGNLNLCDTKSDAIKTLKHYQSIIASSSHPLIIGGGAVGIELAAEIKEHYPHKNVTIVHSRERYLGSYKIGMHDKCFKLLQKLGVVQILGDRVEAPKCGFVRDGVKRSYVSKNGRKIESDLVLLCTGMTPNSHLLTPLSPTSLSSSKYIRVRPTLQLHDTQFPNIFAGGDVIDAPDIKTGSSAFNHAGVIVRNIRKLIDEEKKGRNVGDVMEGELESWKAILPQIFLFLGAHHGFAQLAFKNYLYTAGSWLVRRYFSENVLAARMWDWVGTPLNKKTINL
ncbi:hypothetical protein HK097_009519 [Rhizophlyctis rosea]|uniref:FAD/NAD(P)-binding domain-containing protein n=1 Tax=Rhizophlyctis rosea TaxID=64517 RepID=A0AAD5SBW3_9FUNG|nr:hypothetical protein HK097_009519 [Rhizophlyctis rosea]